MVGLKKGSVAVIAFDLPELELDRSGAAEDVDGDLKLAAVGIDLVDIAGEIGEGAVGDLDAFADVEGDLRDDLVRSVGDLLEDRVDLLGLEGDGILSADEADHAVGLAEEAPGGFEQRAFVVVEAGADEEVRRIELHLALALLAVAEVLDGLDRHQDLGNEVTHLLVLDSLVEQALHLALVVREGLEGIPAEIRGRGHGESANELGRELDEIGKGEVAEEDDGTQEGDGGDDDQRRVDELLGGGPRSLDEDLGDGLVPESAKASEEADHGAGGDEVRVAGREGGEPTTNGFETASLPIELPSCNGD